jgi:ribosomal L5-like protein
MADEKKDKKQKKGKGGEASAERAPTSKAVSTTEAVAPRFAVKYAKEVVPALTKQFGYTNPNQVPRLEKVILNMGLGQAVTNPKIIDSAVDEIRAITGQKPVVTRAKKAIASFKLRQNIPIGAMVTLRRASADARLPRRLAPRVRRQRQLHAWSQGTDHLPGDQLRPHRRHQGNEHLLRDDGEDGRRGACAPPTPGHAVPGRLTRRGREDGSCLSVCEAQSAPEVRGPAPQSLQSVWPRSRVLPQVRALPRVSANLRAAR